MLWFKVNAALTRCVTTSKWNTINHGTTSYWNADNEIINCNANDYARTP